MDMIIRRPYIAVMLASLLVSVSCSQKKDTPPPTGASRNAPITVEGYVIQGRPLSSTIEVPGTLLPFETTEIRPEISGRVTALNIREGAQVKKGSVLVKLFDDDLQAQLRKLQVQLEIAAKTAERQRELLKISGISQQEYDLSELGVNNLKADIELVKVSIGKTEIRAPFNGRIGLKNISDGAYISPTTLITTISQVDRLKLQFTIPEKYGAQVRSGQPVQFKLDGPNKNYQATVMATESSIEENTRTLTVRAVVSKTDAYLVPGAFAKVQMTLGKDNNAIMVPTQAIIPQGRNKQVVVYRGGKAVFSAVTTGVRDSSDIQVLTGLNNGDTVVTTGLLFLRPGSDVKLSKIQDH